jgi:hypothetical protein
VVKEMGVASGRKMGGASGMAESGTNPENEDERDGRSSL